MFFTVLIFLVPLLAAGLWLAGLGWMTIALPGLFLVTLVAALTEAELI